MLRGKRTSLVRPGDHPRIDTVYETMLMLVVLGASAWILFGIRDAVRASEMTAGAALAVMVVAWVVVAAIALPLALQALLLNGRFGVLYGVEGEDGPYLSAPDGLVGFQKKRVRCEGTVEVGIAKDDRGRGSSSTPSTRILVVSGESELRIQVSAPIEDPDSAVASIRSWLEEQGLTTKKIAYRRRGESPAK